MRGFFDDEDNPRLKVKVGGWRREVMVEAVVDTGFTGAISLPISTAMTLGLELFDETTIVLADGTSHHELVFVGTVRLGRERPKLVRILLNRSEDALIGSRLFQGKTLEVDYVNRTVLLRRQQAQRRR